MPQPKQDPAPQVDDGFRLHHSQVPDFPTTTAWIDQLRWCVAVMDANDRDLGFAASLLSYAIDRGGLTEKQSRHAFRLVGRVRALWMADALACQRSASADLHARRSLSDMDTKGSA